MDIEVNYNPSKDNRKVYFISIGLSETEAISFDNTLKGHRVVKQVLIKKIPYSEEIKKYKKIDGKLDTLVLKDGKFVKRYQARWIDKDKIDVVNGEVWKTIWEKPIDKNTDKKLLHYCRLISDNYSCLNKFSKEMKEFEEFISKKIKEITIDKNLLSKIRNTATDEHWGRREDATKYIKAINDNSFLEYLPVWKEWVRDSDPNIRRAVEVGLLRIKKEHIPLALELIEPLLYDEDNYVRKNCGPFALSHIGYKDPEATFSKLKKWMKINNKNVRWNVAMCLGVWFGQSYPKESLRLLKQLSKDKEKFVWRAVASSLIKLIRKHPQLKKEILSWKNCEDCLSVVKKYV
ncbi:HEAT repeat domain-containing protein [Nanoarchaeota archaeon]